MKVPESDIKYAGWRGGIGIAFGGPATSIPDVLELGHEMLWGGEANPAESCRAGISGFYYWNGVVEVSLKDKSGQNKYDFSGMEDKQKASELAFDAFAEINYGVKGLSKYATVQYKPEGTYGDVFGTMDLSGDSNPLAEAVINSYMKRMDEMKVTGGGVGLDNAGKLPEAFLARLREAATSRGLGVVANGCPDEFLKYIDMFGNEGFPYTVQFSREVRAKGYKGIMGEFTMQHLSGGEMELYLKSRLFNRIVFFGYTNGGTAMGAGNSFYAVRPDVYDHQRWVFRKYVAISRSMVAAGLEDKTAAIMLSGDDAVQSGGAGAPLQAVRLHDNGKVFEYKWDQRTDIKEMVESSTGGRFILQHGRDAAKGIYLYVNSLEGERVACDSVDMGIRADAVVYDEFNEKIIDSGFNRTRLEFSTPEGPGLVQIGSRETIARNLLVRIKTILEHELRQMELERKTGIAYPLKQWARFCRGYELCDTNSRTGKHCIKMSGSTYRLARWDHISRMGAAQFVVLDQAKPEPLTVSAWSRSEDIEKVDSVDLNVLAEREKHFDAREAYSYCIRIYLDYQDGQWPEVHSVNFSAGTHDWEQKTIRVVPTRPVKTAMVLFEFQQPKGTAWFDDAELVEESATRRNLLAYPGFENDQILGERMQRTGSDYDVQARKVVESMAAMKITASGIAKALDQIDDLEGIITGADMAAYFGYQVRDCRDAKARLRKCMEILR